MLKAAARRTDHNIDDFDTFVMIQLNCYNLTTITRNIFMYFFKEKKTN